MSDYASVRADIAAVLQDDLPTWSVYDHATSQIDDRSIVLSPQGSMPITAELWRRKLAVVVLVRWITPEESQNTLDSVTPGLRDSLTSIDGVAYFDEIPPPRVVEVAGTPYLAEFHPITVETDS